MASQQDTLIMSTNASNNAHGTSNLDMVTEDYLFGSPKGIIASFAIEADR